MTWWRRNPPPLTVTITADTSKFDEAMRGVRRSLDEVARTIGERLLPVIRTTVQVLSFWLWIRRSGEVLCAGDHEDLVGRCPICKAST